MPRPPALNPDGTRKNPPRERDLKRKARKLAEPSPEGAALINAKPKALPLDFTDEPAPRNPIAERMKRARENVASIPDDAIATPVEVATLCASGASGAQAQLDAHREARIVRANHIILTALAAAECFAANEPEAAIATLSGLLPLTSAAEVELIHRLLPWRFSPVVDIL